MNDDRENDNGQSLSVWMHLARREADYLFGTHELPDKHKSQAEAAWHEGQQPGQWVAKKGEALGLLKLAGQQWR